MPCASCSLRYLRLSAFGSLHRDRLPTAKLRDRFGVQRADFRRNAANGRDAPIPAIRSTLMWGHGDPRRFEALLRDLCPQWDWKPRVLVDAPWRRAGIITIDKGSIFICDPAALRSPKPIARAE